MWSFTDQASCDVESRALTAPANRSEFPPAADGYGTSALRDVVISKKEARVGVMLLVLLLASMAGVLGFRGPISWTLAAIASIPPVSLSLGSGRSDVARGWYQW